MKETPKYTSQTSEIPFIYRLLERESGVGGVTKLSLDSFGIPFVRLCYPRLMLSGCQSHPQCLYDMSRNSYLLTSILCEGGGAGQPMVRVL